MREASAAEGSLEQRTARIERHVQELRQQCQQLQHDVVQAREDSFNVLTDARRPAPALIPSNGGRVDFEKYLRTLLESSQRQTGQLQTSQPSSGVGVLSGAATNPYEPLPPSTHAAHAASASVAVTGSIRVAPCPPSQRIVRDAYTQTPPLSPRPAPRPHAPAAHARPSSSPQSDTEAVSSSQVGRERPSMPLLPPKRTSPPRPASPPAPASKKKGGGGMYAAQYGLKDHVSTGAAFGRSQGAEALRVMGRNVSPGRPPASTAGALRPAAVEVPSTVASIPCQPAEVKRDQGASTEGQQGGPGVLVPEIIVAAPAAVIDQVEQHPHREQEAQDPRVTAQPIDASAEPIPEIVHAPIAADATVERPSADAGAQQGGAGKQPVVDEGTRGGVDTADVGASVSVSVGGDGSELVDLGGLGTRHLASGGLEKERAIGPLHLERMKQVFHRIDFNGEDSVLPYVFTSALRADPDMAQWGSLDVISEHRDHKTTFEQALRYVDALNLPRLSWASFTANLTQAAVDSPLPATSQAMHPPAGDSREPPPHFGVEDGTHGEEKATPVNDGAALPPLPFDSDKNPQLAIRWMEQNLGVDGSTLHRLFDVFKHLRVPPESSCIKTERFLRSLDLNTKLRAQLFLKPIFMPGRDLGPQPEARGQRGLWPDREGPVWAELIPAINRMDKQDLYWSDIIHIVRTKKADPRPDVHRPLPQSPPPPPPAPEEQAASPLSFVQEIASKIEGAFDMVAQSVPPPPELPTRNAITDVPARVSDRGQPQTRPSAAGRPLSADVSPSKTLEFTVELGTDFQSFMSGHDMNEWRLRLHLADFLGVSPTLVHCQGVTAGAGEVFAAAASPSTLMTFTVHPEAHLDRHTLTGRLQGQEKAIEREIEHPILHISMPVEAPASRPPSVVVGEPERGPRGEVGSILTQRGRGVPPTAWDEREEEEYRRWRAARREKQRQEGGAVRVGSARMSPRPKGSARDGHNAHRPSSVRERSVTGGSQRQRVTVPQPFTFEVREAANKRRQQILMKRRELEEERRQRAEDEALKHQRPFHANPVPPSVHVPRYEAIPATEGRRHVRGEGRVVPPSSDMTTFPEREEERYRSGGRSRDRRAVQSPSTPPLPAHRFRANPVPLVVTTPLYQRMNDQKERARRERVSKRREEVMRTSRMPPRMEQRYREEMAKRGLTSPEQPPPPPSTHAPPVVPHTPPRPHRPARAAHMDVPISLSPSPVRSPVIEQTRPYTTHGQPRPSSPPPAAAGAAIRDADDRAMAMLLADGGDRGSGVEVGLGAGGLPAHTQSLTLLPGRDDALGVSSAPPRSATPPPSFDRQMHTPTHTRQWYQYSTTEVPDFPALHQRFQDALDRRAQRHPPTHPLPFVFQHDLEPMRQQQQQPRREGGRGAALVPSSVRQGTAEREPSRSPEKTRHARLPDASSRTTLKLQAAQQRVQASLRQRQSEEEGRKQELAMRQLATRRGSPQLRNRLHQALRETFGPMDHTRDQHLYDERYHKSLDEVRSRGEEWKQRLRDIKQRVANRPLLMTRTQLEASKRRSRARALLKVRDTLKNTGLSDKEIERHFNEEEEYLMSAEEAASSKYPTPALNQMPPSSPPPMLTQQDDQLQPEDHHAHAPVATAAAVAGGDERAAAGDALAGDYEVRVEGQLSTEYHDDFEPPDEQQHDVGQPAVTMGEWLREGVAEQQGDDAVLGSLLTP
ncbi:unnamed protein product [Vitrella brassicaformis CCMP3155]|uniref:Uncharacterized protein n=2 Tax=Vitrella brassicaformis TaxID=1169539 RepID=A0A0G4EA02_VITBC|nr:unnamed protein product [Vitrella brassicaformis CCMP3155]|eukprot:CEL92041.1 unnamed protein product [Vitrella brassicaformis CCMP3155]